MARARARAVWGVRMVEWGILALVLLAFVWFSVSTPSASIRKPSGPRC